MVATRMVARVRRNVLSPAAALLAFVLASGGCSIEQWALRQVSGMLTGDSGIGGTVFTGEEDPQLVAESLPLTMKLHEALLESDPGNAALWMATARLFATYANAFVQGPAEELPNTEFVARGEQLERAKRLYLRGRELILTGFEIEHPGISEELLTGDYALALEGLDAELADYVYWTAASWLGAFSTDQFDFELLLTLERPIAMLELVNEWAPDYDHGSVHEILISTYGGLPTELGGSRERAREHFARAVELSQGKKTSPYLALATAVAVPEQNREEFQALLQTALAIELDVDEFRLLNVLGQRRARWLLDHQEDFFL